MGLTQLLNAFQTLFAEFFFPFWLIFKINFLFVLQKDAPAFYFSECCSAKMCGEKEWHPDPLMDQSSGPACQSSTILTPGPE